MSTDAALFAKQTALRRCSPSYAILRAELRGRKSKLSATKSSRGLTC